MISTFDMKKIFFIIMVLSFQSSLSFAQSESLNTGDLAPEIVLPNLNGDSISLSSLRGKIVLIDFWASWCAPCIKEQPELAHLYKKYKDADFKGGKGFDIYGVSLDSKKAAWEKTIKKLKINWTQVSDLKFWSSPVAQTYHIDALPFNVLIDGEGKIIAMNLHGQELEDFIHSLLE